MATSNFERYERIAWLYDVLDFPFEQGRYRRIRPVLFEGISGRVLEAGVGTGRNFPFYPPGTEVIGVDISPTMLARAERRRRAMGVSVQLQEMNVTRLTFCDQYFDAVVSSFLFCTLPDELQAPALKEIARVVKPGGSIRLLEYSRPRAPFRRFLTRLWEPWVGWAYGASFDRHTEDYVSQVGLKLIEVRPIIDDLVKAIFAVRQSSAPG
jgi:ubiquinone/menaquinone biosynthesis C-methylase UbiE